MPLRKKRGGEGGGKKKRALPLRGKEKKERLPVIFFRPLCVGRKGEKGGTPNQGSHLEKRKKKKGEKLAIEGGVLPMGRSRRGEKGEGNP